ncbi:MAG TPA: hypothetical protein VGM20_09300 [Gemmatimonadales bacterium]|jgi:hypothetical protein
MATDFAKIKDQLAERSVNANYSAFFTSGLVLAAIGLVLFIVSLLGDGSHRAWQAFHVNWIFWTGICAGAIAITAVHKIVGAKWSGVILRLSQATSFFIPVSLIGLVLIMTVGYHDIYGNMAAALPGLSPGKARWLSHSWMAIRMFVGLGLLFWIGIRMIRSDLLPDLVTVRDRVTGPRRVRYDRMLQGYDEAANHDRIYHSAAIYAPLYAFVMTIVAFDGIMALQPHWYSNLLGGWYFMGAWLGALMLDALLMLYARKAVNLREFITDKQRHDLGKLCFGFTVFWTYLMWAQFLVIWYGNMHEETGFVFARLWGPWRPVGAAVGIGVFLIPFAGLLGVAPKKAPLTLGLLATISFASLWLERYLLVTPSVTAAAGPVFGLPELGPICLFLGLFLTCYAIFARTFPMVSPRLALITLQKEAAHHGEIYESQVG